MINGAVLICYQNLEAKILQVVISRLVGNLRGVGYKDVGPAVDGIGVRELIAGAVGVPLKPLVVGVAVAVQVFYIFFQIVDHVGAVEGLTGIQFLCVVLITVGDAVDHHPLIVGDHADNVGPAVDGDGLTQRVVGVAGLVIIPATVVVPALEHIVLVGRSTLRVERGNIQLIQIVFRAAFSSSQRNGLIRLRHIPVAVDNDLYGLIIREFLHGGVSTAASNRFLIHSRDCRVADLFSSIFIRYSVGVGDAGAFTHSQAGDGPGCNFRTIFTRRPG